MKDADAVMLAVPGYGHRAVMDALAEHLQPGQPVIISSHMSFSALYLAHRLAARGVTVADRRLGYHRHLRPSSARPRRAGLHHTGQS